MSTISYEQPDLEGGGHDDPIPDAIWYRVDQSNSYWLYVDQPNEYLGGIPVGIQRAYQKVISSADARAMAQALLEAADEWDAMQPQIEARKAAQARVVNQTSSAGTVVFEQFSWGGQL